MCIVQAHSSLKFSYRHLTNYFAIQIAPSMYKLQYFVCTVLGISTANLLVVVERKRSSSMYQSIDEFTNPYNDTSSCSIRNASCGGVPCTHCRCNTETVFYSYLHGCKSKMEIEKILKVKLVTFSVRNDIIPLVGEDTLNSCVSLSLPIDGVTDCNLDGMYFINIVTGGSDFQFMDYFELVRNTTLSLCLKYTASKRDLAKAYGMLVKLPLQCKDRNAYLTIPFLMTIEGVYVDNSKTFPTQKTVTTTERTFVTNSPTTVTTETLAHTISTTTSTNVSPSVGRETSAVKTETSSGKSTTTSGWITSSKTEAAVRSEREDTGSGKMALIIGVTCAALIVTVLFLFIIVRKICEKSIPTKKDNAVVEMATSNSGDQIATLFLHQKEKSHQYQTIQQPLMKSRNNSPYDYAYSNMAGVQDENTKETCNPYYEHSKDGEINKDGGESIKSKKQDVTNPSFETHENKSSEIASNPIYSSSYALPNIKSDVTSHEYLYPTCQINVSENATTSEYTYAVSNDVSQNPLYVKNCHEKNPIYVHTDEVKV